jgi:dCMP deaminase
MATQQELDLTYLRMAFVLSNISKAKKLKVGALIVHNSHIISEGVNGTPPNESNECETKEYIDNIYSLSTVDDVSSCLLNHRIDMTSSYTLVTKPDVIHAEANAIDKVARSTNSTLGSTMYITHAPCYRCSVRIYNVGIQRLVYCFEYKTFDGVNYLHDRIDVTKYNKELVLSCNLI